jgi:hypothetical protein
MVSLKKRNLEIVKTRNKGATYQDIAALFGLSLERVRQIKIQYDHEEEQRLRSEKLPAIIIKANDIDRKWQTNFLIDGLQFPKKTT